MPQPVADRNLLFGVLALQMDFITREQLIAAMQAWVFDKQKSLGQILCDQKALPEDNRALLEALMLKHLAKHDNDPEKSLAAINSATDVKKDLAIIPDADVQGSLVNFATVRPSKKPADIYATVAPSSSSMPMGGSRFRILRPHARGGLGEVFVARDEELHREVALKEIQERQADNEESRSRFMLEAEITGGLEHPGIVPVYGLGTYGDGRPYYAMRFIRGDSLKDAIDRFYKSEKTMTAGDRNVEYRGLLERFVDVCNAIGYAHSRGVVHRDLKPGNIMLGKFGETLVVDWGLAKPLGQVAEPTGRTEPGEGSLIPHSIGSSSQTMAGSALGTPQYMSPEQAAGRLDQLGPTSDVYSLGATLYCVLTGQPSLTDYDVGMILQKVQRGDFPKPSAIKKTVPRSLEAVCLKAMALKPADRYQTPGELAEDVEHWLADEPVSAAPEPWTAKARRWIGRHRVLVTSAAAAVFVALVGLILATVLLKAAHDSEHRAKLEAQQNFKMAREAVDRYYTEVSESVLLNEPGMLPLRKKLLEAASEYYEKFVNDRADDPALQGELGRATFRLAQITGDIDSLQHAIRLQEKAIAILEKLPAAQAGSDTQSDLATAWHHLGRLSRLADHKKQSEEAYGKALDIWEQLVKDHPKNERYQAGLARTELGLGNVGQLLGQFDSARKHYQQSLDLRLPLAKAHPEIAEYQRDLAMTYYNLAINFRVAGQDQDAANACLKALAIQKKLVDDAPYIGQYQDDLARTNSNLGDLYRRAPSSDRAVAYLQEAARLRQNLAASQPAAIDYQRALARSRMDLAKVYRKTKEWKKAEAACQHALAIQRRLADQNRDVPDRQAELAVGLFSLGDVYRESGRLDEAIAAYKEAIVIQTKLANDYANMPHYLNALADTVSNLGLAYAAGKKLDEAEDTFKQAKTFWERLIKQQPKAPEHARDLAITHENLGNLAKDRGQYQQALDWYGRALEHAPKASRPYLFYNSAAACSLLAASVEMDSSRSAEDRKKTADELAARAVKLLTDAGNALFFSQSAVYRQILATNPDLQFLRGRPEFQNLTEMLKSK